MPSARRAVAHAGPQLRLVLGEPGELGAGEVGVQPQPGELGDPRLDSVGPQPVADAGGAPVLPDDRRPGRVQRAAVPDDGGLALVGDPDAGGLLVGAGERLAAGGDGRRPDVVGLVLDPARAGEQLRELAVAAGQDVALLAHDQRGHPGRSCVDGQHWHGGEPNAPLRCRVRRFFYDTEFIEDGTTIDLVSIGVVDETGREFYAVSTQFDPRQGDPVGAAQRARPAAARRRTRPGAAASASARTCSPSSPAPARRSSSGPGSAPTTTSRCASCGARCRPCRGRSRGSPASCASAGTTSGSRPCRRSRPAPTTRWSTPATTSRAGRRWKRLRG